MIRTGTEYRESIRDGREVFVNGDRVADVTSHPAFRSMVEIRTRMQDMAHAPDTRDLMTVTRNGEAQVLLNALPFAQADWWAKRRATDAVLDMAGGIVTRIGDETVGEMWSLHDCAAALNDIDPRFAPNIIAHVDRAVSADLFHVSGNAGPATDGTEMALRVVRETDAGVVVRGAKYETAAAYANQAFIKPTLTNWGDAEQSSRAIGFVCDMATPGLKFLCRESFATRSPAEDYPLASRLDEADTLLIFDDVLVPWENVLFYRHTRAAMQVRATLHRYSAFAFVQRNLRLADMLIGVALLATRRSGLNRQQPVQEKLSQLALYRETINAHLTAAITLAERSPAGLMMPNQSLLYAGRMQAVSQLPAMIHLTRELCGAQLALMPDAAAFRAPDTARWLDRCYAGDDWTAKDRRRLMAFARDLLNSDYAGHRLTFQLFAQGPPFAQLAAVYRNFDWEGPLALVKDCAGLSESISERDSLSAGDSTVSKWFATVAPQGVAAH
ncbi:pyoverdin chromophore biosynthetic protein PvcC [Gemmobacter nanjingensis]|uniref:Pyoverdin chromophore biosynthetic protein PvcC n=1 Tax=Gemmobacter nanjingensis TaxID=488454 RepID=A0ABQ3FAS4_9RHOB|nr:4-hydroxyphenylacetate 3-hydroxylase N-terminal domain-containing protein [Gemmobacter nanjingensis]GHC16275.1 pyoverdin chromophore biosynthetic protein PvcC [Gemmobacter nanjingensis]